MATTAATASRNKAERRAAQARVHADEGGKGGIGLLLLVGGVAALGVYELTKSKTATPPPGPPSAPSQPDYLKSNEVLQSGNQLITPTGKYVLNMQPDGNLTLVDAAGNVLWNRGTEGNAGAFLIMQTDGNLVLYAANGTTVLWQSGTEGYPGAYLHIQDDGNLVLYPPSGPPAFLWDTGTEGMI